MPPPVFCETVLSLMLTSPPAKMPPPADASFREMVLFLISNLPSLL